MPTRFLSRAELARLGAFPEAIDRGAAKRTPLRGSYLTGQGPGIAHATGVHDIEGLLDQVGAELLAFAARVIGRVPWHRFLS